MHVVRILNAPDGRLLETNIRDLLARATDESNLSVQYRPLVIDSRGRDRVVHMALVEFDCASLDEGWGE